ncbi:hypothetical protein F5Y04DRAFT_154300 [Hypomontagnella monticulosa]|nr:hypothetical protein F5Y04DRAFT_154300 [Hypomontagnella monticulosa]
MARRRNPRRRRTHKHKAAEPTTPNPAISTTRRRESVSPWGGQLATPPASGLDLPSSPPGDRGDGYSAAVRGIGGEGGSTNRSLQREPKAGKVPARDVASPESETMRSCGPPQSQIGGPPVPEPDADEDSGILSLKEKVKLLKISYRHGPEFIRCRTSGDDTEKKIWKSVLKEFSTTVRAGVFTNYAQVKRQNNKICRNRRKKTNGTTPLKRRPNVGNLDMWIDRWVRVWKCCDMITSIANTHQSIRETIGEKRFKRVFRDRMDGAELPEELGTLTLSPPLWKAIRKRIRIIERSSKNRCQTVPPDGSESSDTDEDTVEDAAPTESVKNGLLLRSIEEPDTQPATPEDPRLTANQETQGNLEPRGPSPRTWARLERLGQDCLVALKDEEARSGGRVSVLDLVAQKRLRREQQQMSPPSSSAPPETRNQDTAKAQEGRVQEGHSTSLRVKNPTSGRTVCRRIYVEHPGAPNPARPKRLTPGSYAAGEAVFVGWVARQLGLPNVNVTAEHDFRQGVFATFTVNGSINFRLRKSNKVGELVPSEFRLKGTSVISSRDIVYSGRFRGLSYEQRRAEVARQTLVAAHRRVEARAAERGNRTTEAAFTPMNPRDNPLVGVDTAPSAANISIKPSIEDAGPSNQVGSTFRESDSLASTKEHNTRGREGVQTSSHIKATAERRGDPASKVAEKQPSAASSQKAPLGRPGLAKQKSTSARPGTLATSKEFSTQEARKQQRPWAPYVRSPVRKPSPERRKPFPMRTITPARFYGTQASAWNDKKRESRRLETPPRPAVRPQDKAEAHRNARPSSKGVLPKPVAITPFQQDESDSESLPDVEELYRRLRAGAERSAGQATPKQPSGGQYNRGGIDTEASRKGRSPQAHPNPPRSSYASSRAGTQVRNHSTAKLGEPSADLQEPEVHKAHAGSPSKLRSKKRARRQSTLDPSSSSSAKPSTNLSQDAIAPTQDGPSTTDGHSAKKRKQSPHPEHVTGTGLVSEACTSVEASVSRPRSRSRVALSPQNKAASNRKHEASDGIGGRCGGESVPSRAEDECSVFISAPHGGDSNVPGTNSPLALAASSTAPSQQRNASNERPYSRPRAHQHQERRGQERGHSRKPKRSDVFNQTGDGNRFVRAKTVDFVSFPSKKYVPLAWDMSGVVQVTGNRILKDEYL